MKLKNFEVIRSKELAKLLGVSTVTLWRWEKKGLIPQRISLGPNTRAWLTSDIEAWIEERKG